MLVFIPNYFLFVFLAALLFAKLEIQIEGKHGWAENLPTWRVQKDWFKFLPAGKKPLTGYHFYFWLLLFVIFHFVLLYTPWSIKLEFFILSSYVLTLWVEDFLWFVLNPYYGIRKFNKKNISWHKKWLGIFPLQYYFYLLIWSLLFYFAVSLK